jgi:polyphosphate:AMP phosphotransferase
MLEKVDLSLRLSKADSKSRIAELTPHLRDLQVQHWHAEIPLIVLFEGWDGAGKGDCISLLAEIFDPRGFKVHTIFEPTVEEVMRPFLWRFWKETPAQGSIAIFDRSWYMRVLTDRVDGVVKKKIWRRAFQEITEFERQLADGGTHLVKFWLHISKGEQRKRFKEFEADAVERWRVRKQDWDHHRHYQEYVEAAEEMFYRTDSPQAPWTIVEAECLRHGKVKVLETLATRMEEALVAAKARAKRPKVAVAKPRRRARREEPTILDHVDLTVSVSPKEYSKELPRLQVKLRELEFKLWEQRVPVMVVYEGWDAAGKGGNIKRVTARLDPRGYDVIAISKPTEDELRHNYLWRFWTRLPKAGHLAIFDRSWYGRVLVERVEGFCSEDDWRRAYREINEFEGQLASFGTVIAKFWLQVDRAEQEKRFRAREEDPLRRWKITEEDWRNRAKWDLYEPAVVEMLQRTSTPHAPWTIVESEDKHYARLKALRTLCERIEAAVG